MFTRRPLFIRLQNYGQRITNHAPSAAWWLLMAPGVACTLVALAILLWPELLAYMVASLLLFIGVTLMALGWRVRRAERQVYQHMSGL